MLRTPGVLPLHEEEQNTPAVKLFQEPAQQQRPQKALKAPAGSPIRPKRRPAPLRVSNQRVELNLSAPLVVPDDSKSAEFGDLGLGLSQYPFLRLPGY